MGLRETDCTRGGHGYLSMLSRHDRTVEPGILRCGNKTFACSFRGTADEDGVGRGAEGDDSCAIGVITLWNQMDNNYSKTCQ